MIGQITQMEHYPLENSNFSTLAFSELVRSTPRLDKGNPRAR